MTPDQFIAKWQASTLTERAAAQTHFNDLCALLGEPTGVLLCGTAGGRLFL